MQKKAVSRVGATVTNKILSSYRNGPVKINVGANNVLPLQTQQKEKQNDNNAVIKKSKIPPSQHRRPASPGIHGKVADAPYKSYANSLKSNFDISIFI
jgi:hypothetical protein